jgi:hypothetical protein
MTFAEESEQASRERLEPAPDLTVETYLENKRKALLESTRGLIEELEGRILSGGNLYTYWQFDVDNAALREHFAPLGWDVEINKRYCKYELCPREKETISRLNGASDRTLDFLVWLWDRLPLTFLLFIIAVAVGWVLA